MRDIRQKQLDEQVLSAETPQELGLNAEFLLDGWIREMLPLVFEKPEALRTANLTPEQRELFQKLAGKS